MVQKIVHEGVYDDEFYWSRVRRNLGWLGDTEAEAERRQEVLKNTVVGVAGAGGIGGSMVERLARLGVLHIKVADFDIFELSNINRQLGASPANVGRNKAVVVGEFVHDVCPDVTLEMYPEGICAKTVEDFMAGCDYVLDEIEPYAYNARYLLHDQFHESKQCQLIITGHVYGNRTFLWKYTKDSMHIRDILEVPEGIEMTKESTAALISRLIPERPNYPSLTAQNEWFITNATCPITAGAPPMSQGLIAERLMFEITGITDVADTTLLPPSPGYAMVDSRTWTAKTVEGKWW
jgi:hypothetical protein